MSDFYTLETQDYYTVKGDTLNIGFEFFDEDDAAVDISGYNAKFSVRDPYTDDIIDMLLGLPGNDGSYSKIHNDSMAGGGGVFFKDDSQLFGTGITILESNQLLVILSKDDTDLLQVGAIYDFDVELESSSTNVVITPVRGKLIVQSGHTA